MSAKMACDEIVAAADAIDVKIEPQSWQSGYKAKAVSDKSVDTVDYQENKP